VLTWLTPGRLVPVSALVAALIAALLLTHSPAFRQESTDNEVELLAKIDPQDYDVVADLDNLEASDENSLWDDDDTTSL
jgi:hypothetical protein